MTSPEITSNNSAFLTNQASGGRSRLFKTLGLGALLIMAQASFSVTDALSAENLTTELTVLQKYYDDTKESLDLQPDNLLLKKTFVNACALLKKWDEMVPVYNEISAQLTPEEKKELDQTILFAHDEETIQFKLDPSGAPVVNFDIPYLSCNPLEGLPIPVQQSVQKKMLKGWELLNQDQLKEGVSQFEEAAKINLNPLPFLYLGMFFHNFGYTQEAAYNLEQAVLLAPDNCVDPQLYLTLAYAYRNEGDFSSAVALLEDRLQYEPKNGLYLYNLAKFYEESGGFEYFVNLTERIWTFDPVVFALLKDDYDLNKGKVIQNQ